MRLPYLQLFIDDARRHGRTLAALDPKKRDARWWRGLLEDVWDYGVKVSGDRRPDGIIKGKNATAVLAACVEYPGPALELQVLLHDAGLIERLPDGLRVKGVEELYGKAWDAQEAERKRKADWRAKQGTRTGRGQDADVHPQDGDGDGDQDGSDLPPTPPRAEGGVKKFARRPRERRGRAPPVPPAKCAACGGGASAEFAGVSLCYACITPAEQWARAQHPSEPWRADVASWAAQRATGPPVAGASTTTPQPETSP